MTPTGLVPGPDGTKLYATVSGGVQPYSVNTDGAVTPDQTGVVPAQTGPSALAISRAGTRLFATNAGSDSVSRYAVAQFGGGLTPIVGTTTTGDGPDGIAITPDGAHVYVANGTAGTISILDGEAAATSFTAVDAGTGVSGLAVAPDGSRLYAANTGDDTISGWTIGSEGSLAALPNSPYPAGNGPRGLALTPDGSRLLSADSAGSTLSSYVIATNGALSAPVSTDVSTPLTGVTAVAISPDGKHAYGAGSSTVAAYDLAAAGAITLRGASTPPTGGSHSALAITPDQGPEAKLDPIPQPAGSASAFQGGPSTDPDGSIAKYAWDFGDGSTGTGANPTHTYAQPGTYTVRLTVTDDEGCSTAPIYTGQASLCTGSPYATKAVDIAVPPAEPVVTPEPPCIHDGDDGFCGTPDRKAPVVTVLGFTDGQSLSVLDAPEEIVGTITPDPSGIKQILLKFSKAAGTIRKKKTSYRRVCRKVKGKRRCTRKKQVKRTGKKVPACMTVSGTKTYLVKYECSNIKYIQIQGDTTFRWSVPAVFTTGTYTIDVLAIDGAGNSDVLEPARNQMTLKIVKTSTDTGGATSTPPTGTGTGTTNPVDDTGSPFGHG
jgi:DNA-binding beta-propeller fold protein YncE